MLEEPEEDEPDVEDLDESDEEEADFEESDEDDDEESDFALIVLVLDERLSLR